MEEYRIRGGRRIEGEVQACGAKNAALPILASSILVQGECVLENCPEIADVDKMKHILENLGCRVETCGETVHIDSSVLSSCTVKKELMQSMRSSVFLAGPLLARCGRAEIYAPGGCRIGARPIDIHLSALSKLGADISFEEDKIVLTAKRFRGAAVNLPFPSVGATENAMAAAVCAEGTTVIRGAAKEPEIVDMQDFLNACGGRISGAGTNTIKIVGVPSLHDVHHRIIPDRIEGGTFLTLAAMTGGHIFLKEGMLIHMRALAGVLERAGCVIREDVQGIEIIAPERLSEAGMIVTGPYPGFPTDMQPQIMAMMTLARGRTIIQENIFESRFGIAKELNKMGGDVEINRKNAIINGVCELAGADVAAEDLRGGAALCLAALAASGESTIRGISHIDRGYCDFDGKLRRLGADIQRI